jgi:hypothetical protein
VQQVGLEQGNADERGPDAGEQIPQMLTNGHAKVAVEGLEGDLDGPHPYVDLIVLDSSASLMRCMFCWSWRRMASRARGATSQARPLGRSSR